MLELYLFSKTETKSNNLTRENKNIFINHQDKKGTSVVDVIH